MSGGTYVLLLQLPASAWIKIGKLGSFYFPAGYFTYTGSALGPGGVRARVARHLRKDKRHHWHIDYLLDAANVIEARAEESGTKLECAWTAKLQARKGAVIAPRFGSSDCSCTTHLFYFPDMPDLRRLGQSVSLASLRSSGTS